MNLTPNILFQLIFCLIIFNYDLVFLIKFFFKVKQKIKFKNFSIMYLIFESIVNINFNNKVPFKKFTLSYTV